METLLTTLVTNIETASRTKCGPSWQGTWLNQSFTRLYWVADGRGVVEQSGREYPLLPHRLTLIPGRSHYQHSCPAYMDIYWIHFTARIFGALDLFSVLMTDHPLSLPDDSGNKQRTWDALLAAYQQQTTSGVLAADGFLRLLLAPILDMLPHERYAQRLSEILRFNAVLEYIDRHLAEPLTLEQLAALLQLHPTYFANIFSACFGEGPITYVVRHRIERAQGLLGWTTYSVQEIAEMVGFADPFYFSRAFAKQTSFSPTQFRKRFRAVMP
ncbi:MAG TPA: AraC family transcriptional regulator [Armatimonadota bacterium]|jgi:AraC-like DNA-binding protein